VTAPRTGPTGPMFELRMSVEGETIIARRFTALADRLDDPSPAWPYVAQAARAAFADAFRSEGATTDAGAWPQLADATVAERRRLGFPPDHPILQRTGRLRRSLTLPGSEHLYVPTRGFVMVGSTVEYFPYHQSTAPRTRLPRRAPISLTADQRHEVVRPLRRYLTGHDPAAPVRGR
jgi:phage gpG-like protein